MTKVDETNLIDIYREIKRIYLEWGKLEKLYIDFSGGTKAMSAAAAMACTKSPAGKGQQNQQRILADGYEKRAERSGEASGKYACDS